MTFANKYPPLRPTLLLDFAGSKTVDPRITFSRASAATYFDNKGVLRTAPAGVPRIDYDSVTGECRGLLVEEQRTNLLTYSEQFSGYLWNMTRATITENAAVAPDGTITADKLVEAAGGVGSRYVYRGASVTKGVAHTLSVFAKAGERNYIEMTAFNTPTAMPRFDLTTGAVTVTHPDAIATSAMLVGDGWWRLSVTVIPTVTGNMFFGFAVAKSAMGSSDNYTGDGTSCLYIWGAQLEEGSFPTSYIPTTDSQVTRAADAASMTGTNFSDWANSVGTILAKYKTAGWKHNNTPPVTQLDLTKSVDNYSTSSAGDSIERMMFYPRQLTDTQIAALKG